MVAERHNTGKPQWSLVDWESMEPLVRVLEFGAQKYARDNWKKGMPVNEIAESLLRHLFALMSGEETDPESGLPHTGHIQANAMFLEYMRRTATKSKPKEIDEPIFVEVKRGLVPYHPPSSRAMYDDDVPF